jgi:hypothetical protein
MERLVIDNDARNNPSLHIGALVSSKAERAKWVLF